MSIEFGLLLKIVSSYFISLWTRKHNNEGLVQGIYLSAFSKEKEYDIIITGSSLSLVFNSCHTISHAFITVAGLKWHRLR